MIRTWYTGLIFSPHFTQRCDTFLQSLISLGERKGGYITVNGSLLFSYWPQLSVCYITHNYLGVLATTQECFFSFRCLFGFHNEVLVKRCCCFFDLNTNQAQSTVRTVLGGTYGFVRERPAGSNFRGRNWSFFRLKGWDWLHINGVLYSAQWESKWPHPVDKWD